MTWTAQGLDAPRLLPGCLSKVYTVKTPVHTFTRRGILFSLLSVSSREGLRSFRGCVRPASHAVHTAVLQTPTLAAAEAADLGWLHVACLHRLLCAAWNKRLLHLSLLPLCAWPASTSAHTNPYDGLHLLRVGVPAAVLRRVCCAGLHAVCNARPLDAVISLLHAHLCAVALTPVPYLAAVISRLPRALYCESLHGEHV